MKNSKRYNPFARVLALIVLSTIIAVVLLQVILSFLVVGTTQALAYETYASRSHSPNGNAQSFEEVESEIAETCSQYGWAMQMVSNPKAHKVTMLIVLVLAIAEIVFLANLYNTIEKIKLRRRERLKRKKQVRQSQAYYYQHRAWLLMWYIARKSRTFLLETVIFRVYMFCIC